MIQVHVVRHYKHGISSWIIKVVRGKRTELEGMYRTQAIAIKFARPLAMRYKAELFIHGRDGKIRAKDSYGNDPRRVKG